MTESEIEFFVNKKKVKFKVYHNIGDMIYSAVDNWVARTSTFTSKSLCQYVRSKHSNFICMTESQFNKLNQK
jgi:hypothetical protein